MKMYNLKNRKINFEQIEIEGLNPYKSISLWTIFRI